MRRGITIGFRHGATEPEILAGPEIPLQKQREEFKAQRAQRSHRDFAKIALFDLDDTQSRSARFTPVAVNAVEQPKRSEAPKPPAEAKSKSKKS